MSLDSASAAFGFAGQFSTALFGSLPFKQLASFSWSNGTTPPGQADRLFVTSRTVAHGADQTINLAGTLTDPNGSSVTMVEIAGFLVINKTTTGTDKLTVGGGTNAIVGAMPPLGPSDRTGYASSGDGIAIISGSAQNLLLSASANSIDCLVIVVGRSA